MRLATCAAFAAAVWAAGAAPAQEALPRAEDLIEKHIEAVGGRAAAEKLHSQVLTGTVELVGKGLTGTATVYRAAPNKALSIVEFAGLGKVEEGTDGVVAWSLSATTGPRVKEGAEKAFTIRAANFRGDLLWRDLYEKAELAGVETVDGQPCYKVLLTPKGEGEPVVRYYDKATGMLAKIVMSFKSPQGEIALESLPSDYRKQGDLLIPHKIVQRVRGNEIVTIIAGVENNAEIPAERFAPPKEVQQLLAKKPK